MAEGDKPVLFADQIQADMHTVLQALETALDQFGFDGSALNGIDLPHHEIHEGNAFTVHLIDATFKKNGEMGVIFTTAAGVKEVHMVSLISVDTKSIFDLLEAPTIDVGNYPAQFSTPVNRNRNSDTASIVSSVRAAPVVNQVGIILDGDTTPISADGTNIHSEVVGGTKKSTNAAEGNREASERILKAGTTYYFRVVGDNSGTDDLGLTIILNWYERDSIL